MSRVTGVLRKPRTWIAAGAVVVAAAVGGPFVYINFIRDDAPERLSLPERSASTSTVTAPTGASGASGPSTPATDDDATGTWSVRDGQAGYRVKEVLLGQDTETAGRTSEVTGTVRIEGARVMEATFEVDMATVATGQSLRDGQFRGRIMDTATYPTATFVLVRPINLDPTLARGEQVTLEATGDLTIRGVTRRVSVDLAAVRDGEVVSLNTTIPVRFADYDIPDASFGPAQVQDHGEIELLVNLTRR